MQGKALAEAISKAGLRFTPFLALLYLINYLDRVNIGFAALTMNQALGFTATAFGIGAGMFFVGYVLFEVPSNLILASVGARRWIGRIMISWGVLSMAMCLIRGEASFFVVRFLLGAAEAGFFPGVIYFLVQWFPRAHRARMISLFMVGMPAASLVGAPISSAVLVTMNGVAGLAGWQWLFILEGLPAVIVGAICFRYLVDSPAEAAWLKPDERQALQQVLDSERDAIAAAHPLTVPQVLTNGRVLLLSVLFFLVASCIYGTVFWIPQIVKAFGVSTTAVGLITAVPYLLSVFLSVWWGRHSDRRMERIWHVAIPMMTSAAGFLLAAVWLDQPLVAMAGLSAACIGVYATLPVFWTLPAGFLTGRAAAGGLALITSLGNLSGIITPPVVGWIKDSTGSFQTPMAFLACLALLGSGLAFLCRPQPVSAEDVAAAAAQPLSA